MKPKSLPSEAALSLKKTACWRKSEPYNVTASVPGPPADEMLKQVQHDSGVGSE